MFNTDPNPVHYHALGFGALDCIRLAMLTAQMETSKASSTCRPATAACRGS